jgi:hypothetical protein
LAAKAGLWWRRKSTGIVVARLRTEFSRRGLLAGGVAAAVARPSHAHAQVPVRAAAVQPAASHSLDIAARRIDAFSRLTSETRYGRLTFRGGLVLTATDKDFGGLSGLVLEPDGKGLFAAVDTGAWVTGDITYTGNAPSGITNARLGPIVAQSGRDLTRKRDQDAEAAALVDGNLTRGTILIAFERNHRIGRFPILNRVLQPPTGYLKMPAETRQMSSNKGLEAMTVLAGGPHKGSVVAFSERLIDRDGHHTGWLWVAGEPRRLQVKEIDGFDLTDCASLPDGSLVLLERRFRWTEGVKMRLRLFKPNEIAPGVVAEGEVLLATDMSSEIDNMEGLAVHRDKSGATILTLVSDDNFNSFLQRTILLQFALA